MSTELQGLVDSIVASTPGLPSPSQLATWAPALSGDIPIVIRSDGRWEHAGENIRREGLVRLFASLLRREDDDVYYLVTPVEKWRITVERHALQAIDCDQEDSAKGPLWVALLNTGGRCRIGGPFSIAFGDVNAEPFLDLPNRLTAQITRAAWYRLVDAAEINGDEVYIESAGERIVLGSVQDSALK